MIRPTDIYPTDVHPTKIHLVGSVPLPSAEAVFEKVCGAIGPYLSRLSDGETGERGGWISFQRTMLIEHPAVIVNPAGRTFPTRDLEGNVRRINDLFSNSRRKALSHQMSVFRSACQRPLPQAYSIFIPMPTHPILN